jgi:hypothetical protein
MINGTDQLRQWYEQSEKNWEYLDQIESVGMDDYISKREQILIYN